MTSKSYVFDETDDGLIFKGDFEGLYHEQADPWEQAADHGAMATYYDQSRLRLVSKLQNLRDWDRAMEIGCGHGYVTKMIEHNCRRPCLGVDVSRSAVTKARMLHRHIQFEVGNVLEREFLPLRGMRFGVVIWGQILWYVLEDFERALGNTLARVSKDGYFVITQAFLRDQQYGRGVVDGFNGLVRRMLDMSPKLQIVSAYYDDTEKLVHHDGLLVMRVRE